MHSYRENTVGRICIFENDILSRRSDSEKNTRRGAMSSPSKKRTAENGIDGSEEGCVSVARGW